jgi:hypothetical protein
MPPNRHFAKSLIFYIFRLRNLVDKIMTANLDMWTGRILVKNGTTVIIMTFSIRTLSIKRMFDTLIQLTHSITTFCHSAE